VQISDGETEIYVVSQYFPPAESIEVGIDQLEKVLRSLRGKKIIIGLDSNAKSPLWCSRTTDGRGEALEAIIAQYGLHVLNRPGQSHTFETTRSNIDVTMASPEAIPLVKEWKVHEDGTSSDHRILETRLDFERRCTPPQLQRRYNTKIANWEVFQGVVIEEKETLREITLQQGKDVERMAEQMQEVLIRACNAAIPKKKWHYRPVPWWTPELTRAKKNVYRAKRRFQGARDPATREQEKLRHREIRKEYTRAIVKAKIQSWQDFVTKEGNREP
jgi:hypothetical protein